MRKYWYLCIAGLLFWSMGNTRAQAQTQILTQVPAQSQAPTTPPPAQPQEEIPPALRQNAIVLQITTKVEQSNKKVWTANSSKATLPGRPVNIKLVGENIVIEIQFTPILRQGKYTLTAQSKIWIEIPEKGVSYKTASQSTPIDFKEPIIILPLGSDTASDNPRIELHLTMYRYGEEPAQADSISESSEETPAGRGH